MTWFVPDGMLVVALLIGILIIAEIWSEMYEARRDRRLFTSYSFICKACKASCGGCITGPGLPEAKVDWHTVCPECHGRDIELVKDH